MGHATIRELIWRRCSQAVYGRRLCFLVLLLVVVGVWLTLRVGTLVVDCGRFPASQSKAKARAHKNADSDAGTSSADPSRQELLSALLRFSHDLKNSSLEDNVVRSRRSGCDAQRFGRSNGGHFLCRNLLAASTTCPDYGQCNFLSYGINRDFSFDTALASHGCRGFLFDPTVSHPFHITDNSVFLKVGAPLLNDTSPWASSSAASVATALALERIAVLKMDCEGCEYAISDSILCSSAEPGCDRHFFDKVDQFTIEVHTLTAFAPTAEHVMGLAKLLWLLDESGLKFVLSEDGACSRNHQVTGCPEEFRAAGFDCGHGCKNPLFARVPPTAALGALE
mmetsp:Transcript_48054/g.125100  ORF Transcript_48054/g.125100 Transcript_48054/m.125100 type:complete len:338 (+) Transcript_48054:3-1016(+)